MYECWPTTGFAATGMGPDGLRQPAGDSQQLDETAPQAGKDADRPKYIFAEPRVDCRMAKEEKPGGSESKSVS